MEIEKFGFKKVYGVDIGASLMQYQEHQSMYQRSQCFNNAFICLGYNLSNYAQNKAIFGYVLSTDGVRRVAVRHCWNIINQIVVDVTMFADNENPVSMLRYSYLPVMKYTPNEFLEAVERNGGFPALPKTQKEYYYIKELKKKGFEVME